MAQLLNLIDGEIQHSNLFRHMPIFDEIHYLGYLEGKIRKYRAVREDQACTLLALNVIRKDEDILWDAAEDFVKRSVMTAAAGVRGVYTFDLLTIDIHKEIKTYNFQELATVITNHARMLEPGGQRLVKYSTAYGILQKMSHQDWGKIIFKTSVEVFKDKAVFLDLLIKQLVKNFEFSNDPGILLVNDLSSNPLFCAEDQEQQKRLTAVIRAQIPNSIDFPPEVFIQDKNGIRELLSSMQSS